MLGIQAGLGTWYAYRVLVLLDSECTPSGALEKTESPCATCEVKACVANCPAGAMSGGTFVLDKCISYRNSPASRCETTCIARTSCPVGAIHRYSDEQMRHMYAISLDAIKRYC
jgi:Fe-S-cluster-containing hydrogenase component 2